MKMLSDNAVTKHDLNAIDDKQTKQIIQLRYAVGASFLFNLILSVGLFFFK